MNKNDWNPEQYLKFDEERTRPSIDLVARIPIDNPSSIIDIGCGPGNSTQVLARRWPGCKIVGVDNSPAMIERAKKDYPRQEWRILDAGKDEIEGTFEIVFSNATIQWIPNHADLLKKFHGLLTKKGIIAIQIPLFWDMPIGKTIANIATSERWSPLTGRVSDLFSIHDPSYYYDKLSELSGSIDIWVSDYFHVLDSHVSIFEMIRSTGLRPYLERLRTEQEKNEFEGAVLREIARDYPLQKNGRVLFPFKRLFFVAGG
jgi:trans-aconitate 2-methyltransferase